MYYGLVAGKVLRPNIMLALLAKCKHVYDLQFLKLEGGQVVKQRTSETCIIYREMSK